MVIIALELVIQHFLSTPEARVCKNLEGWNHDCPGCLKDADTLSTLYALREKFKNL